jgi:hypothetical protein
VSTVYLNMLFFSQTRSELLADDGFTVVALALEANGAGQEIYLMYVIFSKISRSADI